jgi:hypothetical protein
MRKFHQYTVRKNTDPIALISKPKNANLSKPQRQYANRREPYLANIQQKIPLRDNSSQLKDQIISKTYEDFLTFFYYNTAHIKANLLLFHTGRYKSTILTTYKKEPKFKKIQKFRTYLLSIQV